MNDPHGKYPGLAAVILAAGESSRMGAPKALLGYRGEYFIEAVRAALEEAGVGAVIAVLGGQAAEIRAKWKPEGVVFAVNPRPEDGQLSSLRAGLKAAPEQSEAALICLVDQPAIATETYKKIIAFWSVRKEFIIIPRVKRPPAQSPASGHKSQVDGGKLQSSGPGPRITSHESQKFKRGHPIIIPAAHYPLCFEGPLEAGLHWITHHPSSSVLDLDVDDGNIISDIDTPEDYCKLKEGF